MIVSDIPIIKLFVVGRKYYVYDAYCNEILCISKELYLSLQRLLEKGIDAFIRQENTSVVQKDIRLLMERGYLSPPFVSEIARTDDSLIEEMLSRCLSALILQVTQNCNFSCRYCLYVQDSHPNRTHSTEKMSIETAKQSVDFMFDHAQDSHEITLSFYGGEPLLNFEVIRDTVIYAEQKFAHKQVTFHTTINGSLLSKEIIAFLVEHNFYLMVSLDGPKHLNDKHRKFRDSGCGTFDIVYKNILKIKEMDEDYFRRNVRFMSVYFLDENTEEIQSFFKEIGISASHVNIVPAYLSGIDYGYDALSLAKRAPKDNSNLISKATGERYKKVLSEHTKLFPVFHPGGACVPGVTKLFVNTSGCFYPCEKVVESDYLSIGNLENGFDIEKVRKFANIGRATDEDCKSCWAMRFCNMCIVHCTDVNSYTIQKSVKKQECFAQKRVIESWLKEQVKQFNK